MHSMTFEIDQYFDTYMHERNIRIGDKTFTPKEFYQVAFPVSINVFVGEDDTRHKSLLLVTCSAHKKKSIINELSL